MTDLLVNYRGVDYRISRGELCDQWGKETFLAVVSFPDCEESAAYRSEEQAVAASENLIDDYFSPRQDDMPYGC